jgi:hypothetical protein
MASLFAAAALPRTGGAARAPVGAPAPPLGAGVVAEDERGRVYCAGADGLLRVADARAALAAAKCVLCAALHAAVNACVLRALTLCVQTLLSKRRR